MRWNDLPQRAKEKAREFAPHWPLLLILALAFYFRYWNAFPTFFYGDDAEYATVAGYLASDPFYMAYPDIEQFGPRVWVSQPPLVIYIMAFFTKVMGNAEVGSVMANIVLGTLTVAVVYAIGVELQGRLTGVLSGLFLSVLPFHIKFSQSAYLDAGVAFFFSLAILTFLVWHKKRTAGWAVLTGVAAGATCLTKLYGFLIFLPLLAAVLWELIPDALTAWRFRNAEARARVGQTIRHMGLAAIPIAILGFGYIGFLFWLRGTIALWRKIMWNIGRVAPDSGLAPAEPVQEDHDPWWYYVGDQDRSVTTEIGGFLTILAVAGAIILITRALLKPRRNSGAIAFLMWPVGMLAFLSWMARKVFFYAVPVIPGVIVLAAIPAAMVIEAFMRPLLHAHLPAWRQGIGSAAVATSLVVAAIPAYAHADYSYEEFMIDDSDFGYGVKEAAFYVHERDPDAAMLSGLLARFTLHFYNGQPSYHWYLNHDWMEQEACDGDLRFVIVDNYLGSSREWEERWLEGFAANHSGVIVKEYSPESWWHVQVYELQPGGAHCGKYPPAPMGAARQG